jgi:predicted membrane protein (TIGR00267 family)
MNDPWSLLGAATALAASGITSAYLSEQAERRRELRELEVAMAEPIPDSAHGQAARVVPVVIALGNGLSPLLISLAIMTPLWLASSDPAGGDRAVLYGIALAFVAIFALGSLLGRIGHTFWLWSGIRAVLIGAITCGVILGVR